MKMSFLSNLPYSASNNFVNNKNDPIMSKANIPEGYQAVIPYFLVSDGDQFFTFLKTVFEATEKAMHRDGNGRLMHGEASIDGSIVMFGESNETWKPEVSSVFIYVKDTDATYKRAMDAGSTSRQAPESKDYGRAAGIRDPFGNTWWITSV